MRQPFPTSASANGTARETVASTSRATRELPARQSLSESESESELEGEGGGDSQDTRECSSSPSDGTDAAPPPQCPIHPDGNSSDPCRGCAAVRLLKEQQAQAEEDKRKQKLSEARALRENCITCGGTSWIPDTEPAVRCYHLNGQPVADAVMRK